MSFRASNLIFLLIFLTASVFSISLRARQSPSAESKLQTLYTRAQQAQSRHDYEEAARDYAGILNSSLICLKSAPTSASWIISLDGIARRWGIFRRLFVRNPIFYRQIFFSASIFFGFIARRRRCRT